MGEQRPSGRLFGLPAWAWCTAAIGLLVTANVVAVPGPGSQIDEPGDRQDVTAHFEFVTLDGIGLLLVPFEQTRGVAPLWALTLRTTATTTAAANSHWFIPGLVERSGRWTYELSSNRIDAGAAGDKTNPAELSSDQLRMLRPRLVDSLNRGDPGARRGDRLESLLTNGLDRRTRMCPENAVVVASWIALAAAVVSLVLAFVAGASRRPAS
jgi:hypothetical protein